MAKTSAVRAATSATRMAAISRSVLRGCGAATVAARGWAGVALAVGDGCIGSLRVRSGGATWGWSWHLRFAGRSQQRGLAAPCKVAVWLAAGCIRGSRLLVCGPSARLAAAARPASKGVVARRSMVGVTLGLLALVEGVGVGVVGLGQVGG